MAKMFYTLEEAAQKLGMDVDDVKGLTESGQLQEFRDQDQIMLKVEQVDLRTAAFVLAIQRVGRAAMSRRTTREPVDFG